MNCPKCGAAKMSMDKPVYFNRDNQEGDFLYSEELRRCRICGKVVFIKKNLKKTRMKFVKGQVITGGYENL
ncbi:MAG: hypothetical protein AABY87_09160 [bacterium]